MDLWALARSSFMGLVDLHLWVVIYGQQTSGQVQGKNQDRHSIDTNSRLKGFQRISLDLHLMPEQFILGFQFVQSV